MKFSYGLIQCVYHLTRTYILVLCVFYTLTYENNYFFNNKKYNMYQFQFSITLINI